VTNSRGATGSWRDESWNGGFVARRVVERRARGATSRGTAGSWRDESWRDESWRGGFAARRAEFESWRGAFVARYLRDVSLLRDYSNQARTYDDTRGASPSVLGPLREALDGAPGRRLVDIGGGTGNYSRALRDVGWEPLVIDREPAMLAHAAAKGLATLEGDARRLPLPDECADAAMLVSMLHHVEDQPKAIAEARRILRPKGRLVLMGWSYEDLSGQWMADYWPTTRAWMAESHPKPHQLLELMPTARRIEIVYRDLEDGSLAALSAYPEKMADPRRHRQTSYFERLARDHPEELEQGLERLRRDIKAGTAPRTPGRASVLVETKAG
jgi:ubiquinone/menaquinone biosynthesis C-methylase UbiE